MTTETSMPDGYKASYSTGFFGVYPFASDDTYYDIMKFDKALGDYFADKGRSDYYSRDELIFSGYGRFKAYVEENGADEADIWQEEMKQLSDQLTSDNEYDGLLAQFFDDYPEEEKERESSEDGITILIRIKNLRPGERLNDNPSEQRITVRMFDEITDKDIDETTEKYRKQMPSVIKKADKDKELKWFLAASEKVNYPFLTFMVDSYTKERAKMNDEDGTALPMNEWIMNNPFMKALLGYNGNIHTKLKHAIEGYSNRIMPRLQIGAPAFKIKDDLKEVTEYIVAVAGFIRNLMVAKTAVVKAPFIVDLLIAVKSVEKVIKDEQETQNDDDSDDDDDDDQYNQVEEKEFENPDIDYIGHVQKKLKSVPCHHFPKKNYDRNAPTNESVTILARELQDKYYDFRTKMQAKDYGDDDSKQPEIQFNPATYPQFRRFSVFVDRRENKPTKGNKDKDQITFFQQPNECSIMETDHVYEVGFEFARKCLIPERRDAKDEHITAITAKNTLCGQLLTFMFDVKAIDEIKCYIIYNGQTMRFEYEHITQVLPYLFTESDKNKKFDKKKGEGQILKDEYQRCVADKNFETFHKEFKAFTSQ